MKHTFRILVLTFVIQFVCSTQGTAGSSGHQSSAQYSNQQRQATIDPRSFQYLPAQSTQSAAYNVPYPPQYPQQQQQYQPYQQEGIILPLTLIFIQIELGLYFFCHQLVVFRGYQD